MANPIVVALVYPLVKNYLVDLLKRRAAKTETKLDDKLVKAVELSLDNKDYSDVVSSVTKEVKRAEKKVNTVKQAVKKAKKK